MFLMEGELCLDQFLEEKGAKVVDCVLQYVQRKLLR
jgi:hypothetical protein